MLKKITGVITAICFTITFSGCATIVSGRNQELPVYSTPSGAIVTVGSMKQTTPATFSLDRRQGAYVIKVEMDGYESVEIKLKKGTNGWVFGNILLGLTGIIGIIVDISNGSAKKFVPDEVDVNLIKQGLSYRNLKDKDILFVKLVDSSKSSLE